MVTAMFKTCIRCQQTKLVDLFHRHKGMRDGRLNKCAECVVECVAEWRANNPGCRQREYMRGRGAAIRERGLKKNPNGTGIDQTKKAVSALKYSHKARISDLGRPVHEDELTDFVVGEAVRLCRLRGVMVGGEWEIDHIVPIKGRLMSGLHNGFNLQVVPRVWNQKKHNKVIAKFLGGE